MAVAAFDGLLPDPNTTDFMRWAAVVTELGSQYNLSEPESEEFWQNWAVQFSGLTDTAADEVPDPYGFSDWRDWASRWVQIQG